ncbi:methyltransferase, FxLD system [Amycolatopsis acidicola]|uniref:Protein-L-isoaspartate O-methyltransferase n=2 Tax=Amycolatopsis acidicola TaxID=2596893 RepID=A0A5N0VF62_9PSEU|nr:methyltransferase, FxLD system [Amycolatopsis acidicola]
MVDHVRHAGFAENPAVEEALRTVPRHQFVPAATIADAYANAAVITKRAADGSALSCASVPTVVAMMLDQLDVHPGHTILEIGAGTGYNAALLAHLTGPTGHVTSIDIDPDVTAGARHNLDTTGNTHVTVLTRDGTLGAPEHAPYDRIIVTVGAFDIPKTWTQQIAPDGRLVVPLRWRGQTRSLALTHHGNELRSDSARLCGFVPMIGHDTEHSTHLDPDGHVTLHWDPDQTLNPDTLHGVLATPKTEAWSGITITGTESYDGIWLRLTGTEPGTCRLTTHPTTVHTGLCTPANPSRTPALAEHDSLAYLTHRRINHGPQTGRYELGATGHGTRGPALAQRLSAAVKAWGTTRNDTPTITISPKTNRAGKPLSITKNWTYLTVNTD